MLLCLPSPEQAPDGEAVLSGERLLTREIVYTAVTRARKLALIYGTSEMLALAMSRKVERYGLND